MAKTLMIRASTTCSTWTTHRGQSILWSKNTSRLRVITSITFFPRQISNLAHKNSVELVLSPTMGKILSRRKSYLAKITSFITISQLILGHMKVSQSRNHSNLTVGQGQKTTRRDMKGLNRLFNATRSKMRRKLKSFQSCGETYKVSIARTKLKLNLFRWARLEFSKKRRLMSISSLKERFPTRMKIISRRALSNLVVA